MRLHTVNIWHTKKNQVIDLEYTSQVACIWFFKKNRITSIVYMWFTLHFACRIEKCFLSIILIHVCLSHHIQFRLKLKFTTQVSNFLHNFQVNTEYVILKANYCLSAPLKVKTTPMPRHKSNAPDGIAIAISPPIPFSKTRLPQSNNLNINFTWQTRNPFFRFQERVTVEDRKVQLMS